MVKFLSPKKRIFILILIFDMLISPLLLLMADGVNLCKVQVRV